MFLTATTTSSNGVLLEETTRNLNAISKYWHQIDWDQVISTLISKSLTLALILVTLFLIKKMGNRVIQKSFARYYHNKNFSDSRTKTLQTITYNCFQYSLYFILVYAILTVLGVPVGSLIAGAGIAGIALGLGAQGFINDFLTGFFIISERQLDVGDHVIINNIEGVVVAIGMRTTQIKSGNGTLHFIPNRHITTVSNLSRGNMLAIIKLRLTKEVDLEQLSTIVKETNAQLVPAFPEIQKEPQISGVVESPNGSLALQIIIETLSGSQSKIQTAFLTAYTKAIQEAGIDLPPSPFQLDSN